METPELLWIDLAQQQSQPDLYRRLAESYPVCRVDEADAVPEAIRRDAPRVLCFDYDFPDRKGLKALQQTKLMHPSLPILMLTDYHSEALAVWAFRTRVWDYLIKPLKPEEVIRRVTELFKLLSAGHSRKTRIPQSSVHPLPLEVRWSQGNGSDRAILPVVSYVEVHYPEKITLEEMARLCGLGPFQFSRLFKRLKGVTFQEFLLQHRIGKALMLLRNPRASVTDVAFAVGFNDMSYFARMFRRYVGLCPSKYRKGNGSFNNPIPPV